MRPSRAGFVGTLVVTGLLLVLSAVLLRPSALAGHRWIVEPIDDFAWLAGNLVRYQHASPEAFHVAIVGTSATREAISDDRLLEAELEAVMGRPVEVHLLVAGSLYPLEYLVVADHVPPEAPGLVVLEVSERNLGLEPRTWHWLANNPRLPLHSPAYRERVALAGFRARPMIPGLYLSEHLDFYAARIFSRVAQRFEPIAYHLHAVDALASPSPQEWERMQANYEHWLRVYDTHQEQVLPIYQQLVGSIRERSHSSVAFLQAPRNPQFVQWVESRSQPAVVLRSRYQAQIEQLAGDLGVPCWDLVDAAGVAPEGFRDHAHIRDPASRERYTRALARAIAAAAQAGEEIP